MNFKRMLQSASAFIPFDSKSFRARSTSASVVSAFGSVSGMPSAEYLDAAKL